MKERLFLIVFLCASIFSIQIRLHANVQYGLASEYPGDKGIKNDRSIVFTEDFEEPTLDDVAAHWDEVVNLGGMSLESDVPIVSSGIQSLQMTSIIGQNTGGHLYKRLVDYAGYDTLYARFYVKFAQNCHPVHHFVHMGGYNPPTPWPQGGAGVRPNGDERFTTGIEPMGSAWRWDFYTYWMHMRGNPVPNTYWGNTFHPTPTVPVERGEWICVEIMMICNNPLGSYNGEQAFWINGEPSIHLGEGFPNGYWIWDKFYPHPDSVPFEGFQWRIVDELKVNFFWLLFYMTEGPPGQIDTVWFDDVIVATEYIGPLTGIEEDTSRIPSNESYSLSNYPNPCGQLTVISYQLPVKSRVSLTIYDITGRQVITLINKEINAGYHSTKWNTEGITPGIYLAKLKACPIDDKLEETFYALRKMVVLGE
ncbi:T9SS type A sorting domain-containing protein [candidate division WOR-3 bacterium]|nr:T9SS type A sorting domain-containing protein [candidate division WOR-3 bacterium]